MRSSSFAAVAVVAVTATVLGPAARARACGGLLQPEAGTVAQAGQVALLVVDRGKTGVVLTLDVPDAGNAFGVLVPVPGEPDIDPQPVSDEALTALEARTRPVVGVRDDGGGDPGFGCGLPLSGSRDFAAEDTGVLVGDRVAVGPVSAQWVSGETGAAVSDWLAQEGFVLPAGGQAIVDGYVNGGLSFLAFTRNDTASGAARVGVHFTLDGDHRAYALQMSTLGAADAMAFTIFVATDDPDGTAPDSPYAALTVAQLDAGLLHSDYAAAVKKGVAAVGGKAFVVETKAKAGDLFGDGVLAGLVPDGHTITRMSSVAAPADLDADVTFTSKAPSDSGGAHRVRRRDRAAGVAAAEARRRRAPRVAVRVARVALAAQARAPPACGARPGYGPRGLSMASSRCSMAPRSPTSSSSSGTTSSFSLPAISASRASPLRSRRASAARRRWAR